MVWYGTQICGPKQNRKGNWSVDVGLVVMHAWGRVFGWRAFLSASLYFTGVCGDFLGKVVMQVMQFYAC
jgi:hypothetical protein